MKNAQMRQFFSIISKLHFWRYNVWFWHERYKTHKKFIPSSHYLKIYHCLFLSHLTYGITCWGGAYTSKLQKLFNIQKRCIRMLFGDIYSFDHPEYYYTCARLITYTEYKTDKNYTLEHTKPLFNKLGFLTLYIIQSLYLAGFSRIF